MLLEQNAETDTFKEVGIKLTKTIILLLEGYNTRWKQATQP
jgi:hypothetical protein